MNFKKKFSIITVSYNSEKTIEKTILSVVLQTCKDIEYIIIDGGSTDGTIDIIKKYEGEISYWMSEPDDGIYDAMNKGIKLAHGDYIFFLGSDDILFAKSTISKLANKISFNSDIIYGKVMLYDMDLCMGKECGARIESIQMKKGKMIPHQGMFVKMDLIKKYQFNTKYKIAADFDFLINAINDNCSMQYLDQIIAYYNVNGVSSATWLREKEYMDILKQNNEYNIHGKFNNNKAKIYSYMFKVSKILNMSKLFKRILGWKGLSIWLK